MERGERRKKRQSPLPMEEVDVKATKAKQTKKEPKKKGKKEAEEIVLVVRPG